MNIKLHTYEVTLRRDVQQVVQMRVEAADPRIARAVAEAAVSGLDDETWKIEEHLGSHEPRAVRVQPPRKKKVTR